MVCRSVAPMYSPEVRVRAGVKVGVRLRVRVRVRVRVRLPCTRLVRLGLGL